MASNHSHNLTLGALTFTILVLSLIELTEFDSFGIVKGQVTAQQNSGMCDPNDKSINGTESRICGVPKTTGSSSAANTTSAVTGTTTTSPSDNTTTQGAVPGVIP
jgi:hypothetical protein